MCLASGMGASLELADGAASGCGWWFGEDQGRYLLAIRGEDAAAILAEAQAAGVIARAVGRTGGDALILGAETPISVERLRAAHEDWLPGYMAADAAT